MIKRTYLVTDTFNVVLTTKSEINIQIKNERY